MVAGLNASEVWDEPGAAKLVMPTDGTPRESHDGNMRGRGVVVLDATRILAMILPYAPAIRRGTLLRARGREASRVSLDSVFWQQFTNTHFECAGNGMQLEDRDVPHAALDPRHVRAVQAGVVGKLLLRQTTLHANRADSVSDLSEQGLRGPSHAPMLGR